MYGVIIFLIIFILKYLLKEDEIAEKPIRKKYMYETNCKNDHVSLEQYYLQILGLSNCKSINPKLVDKAYYDKLGAIADRRLEGETIVVDIAELRAAKAYLIDTCNYLGGKN